MNKTASNFTGTIPQIYETGLVPVIFEDYAREMANRVLALKPTKVLELAAGTGVVTHLLSEQLVPECEIIASDLNAPMLAIAREKIKSADRVSFEVVDAMNIPFEDQSVDVIACQFGVMFFPDKVQSYREVHRVLRKGGKYIFSVWDSHAQNPFAAITQKVVEEALPADPPGFYKVPFHYNDPDEVRREIMEAGFSAVEVEHRPISKVIPSIRSFANALVYGNPLCEELRDRNADPEQMAQAIQTALEAAFAQEQAVMPLSAYFVTGQK